MARTVLSEIRTYLFILLQTSVVLIAAQTAGGTGVTSSTNGAPIPSQSSPPFPIPLNSTSTVGGTGLGFSSSTSQYSTATLGGTGLGFSSSASQYVTTISLGSAGGTTSSTSITVPLSSTSATSSSGSSNGLSSTASTITNSTAALPPLSSSTAPISSSSSSGSEASSSSLGSTTVGATTVTASTSASSNTGSITAAQSSTTDISLPSGITLAPVPTTEIFDTTGTVIQTSASQLSILLVGMFPKIQSWIDDPQPPTVTAVTDELDDILPSVSDFLDKLPVPTGPLDPCQKGPSRRREVERFKTRSLSKRSFLDGLFKTVFNLVTCIIDDTNKLKEGLIDGVEDTVNNLVDDLKPMIDALNDVEPDDNTEPSASVSDQSSSQPSSSSSSSCSLMTASNCRIICTATAITTVGGAKRQAPGNACSTSCGAPITACSATAVTSVSIVTSTSSVYHICAVGSPECNNNDAPPQPTGLDLSAYLTATNGEYYLPAETTFPSDETLSLAARGNTPRETGSPSPGLSKRALSNPSDFLFGGDVDSWIRWEEGFADRLPHSIDPQNPSTAFTYPLTNYPASWGVVNLYGCTSVIVVSRKRMWMSHFFEDPSFVNSNNLQPQIIGPLRNGGAGIQQGIAAFTGVGGDFENLPENHVRAFIVTPNRRNVPNPAPDDWEYPYEVGKIRDELHDILGRNDELVISYIPRWADAGYNGNPNLFAHPWGKIIVQYDPVQNRLQAPGGCQLQVAQLEIWVENNPLYRYKHYWNAEANQIVPLPAAASSAPAPSPSPAGNGKMKRFFETPQIRNADEDDWKEYGELLKRQDGGSCSLSSAPSGSSSVSAPTSTDPTTLQTVTVSNSLSVTSDPPSTAIGTSTAVVSSTPEPSLTPVQSSTPVSSPTSSSPAYSCIPYEEDASECQCTPTNCQVGTTGCYVQLLVAGQDGCDAQCNGCQMSAPSSTSAPAPSSTPAPSPTTSSPAVAYSCAPYEEDSTECSCTPTNCTIGTTGCFAQLMSKGQNGCDDNCNGCQI